MYITNLIPKVSLVGILVMISSIAFSATWPHSSGDYKSQRSSSSVQITEDNINKLEIAWEVSKGAIVSRSPIQASPIYTGSKIISLTNNSVYALNPIDGELIWETIIDEKFNYQIDPSAKGISSHEDQETSIYIPTTEGILILDENTGKILDHYFCGHTALPPIIHDNKMIVATRWSGVKAFDISTRNLLWNTEINKNGYQSHIWSGFSYSKKLQTAFIVTGSSGGITGWYRNESNFDNSLLAIDVETGKIKWAFQHIEHDLWDLDTVGNPIIFDINDGAKVITAILALTKTGDIIFLNGKTGNPIFSKSFIKVMVPKSDVPNEESSPYQKKFLKPQPFTSTVIDLDKAFMHLDEANLEYVKSKTRRAQSGFYLPPSLHHDIVLYGLHGGAEWPGGAINFASENPELVVPFNKDPWIIRTYYRDNLERAFEIFYSKYNSFKNSLLNSEPGSESVFRENCASCHENGNAPNRSYLKQLSKERIYSVLSNGSMSIFAKNLDEKEKNDLADYLSYSKSQASASTFKSLPFTPNNSLYNENCLSCHGPTRKGFFETEAVGDGYYPPLVGITLTEKRPFTENFKEVRTLHNKFNIPYKISKKEHDKIFKEFHSYDSILNYLGLLSTRGFWQVLLDKDKNPATTPPWGGIAKIDLVTGKEIWNVPFGSIVDANGKAIANGVKNFGGVITTKSGLIFATGTIDSKAYAFNIDGKEIWSDKLPYSGSAPPISFNHSNCQYVLFTATGGKWHDTIENGNSLVSYKLNDCKNE